MLNVGNFKNMADEIVLSFHDSLLRKSDLRLLEEGRWLNDRLIGFMFDYFTHNQFIQISEDVLFISPDVTQFLKLGQGIEIGIFIEPLNLPSHKLVFFAVNDNDSTNSAGGSHWKIMTIETTPQTIDLQSNALTITPPYLNEATNMHNKVVMVKDIPRSLLMYNRQANSFHHYDSSKPYNTSAARSLAKNVEPFLHAKGSPSFVEDRCPQQQNGYDCGVYVINITEELCSHFLRNEEKFLTEPVTVGDISKKRKLIKTLILNLGQKKTK